MIILFFPAVSNSECNSSTSNGIEFLISAISVSEICSVINEARIKFLDKISIDSIKWLSATPNTLDSSVNKDLLWILISFKMFENVCIVCPLIYLLILYSQKSIIRYRITTTKFLAFVGEHETKFLTIFLTISCCLRNDINRFF